MLFWEFSYVQWKQYSPAIVFLSNEKTGKCLAPSLGREYEDGPTFSKEYWTAKNVKTGQNNFFHWINAFYTKI